MRRYVLSVLIGADILLNAILGGKPYATISDRMGESIEAGGWASRVPWPLWLKNHFHRSIFRR